MKKPTHNIKTTPWHKFTCGLSPLETHQMPCWLGSGISDRNGVEIFEGDIVILDNQRGVVRFANAQFYIDRDGDDNVPFTLNRFCSPFIEVVGHIAEEQL